MSLGSALVQARLSATLVPSGLCPTVPGDLRCRVQSQGIPGFLRRNLFLPYSQYSGILTKDTLGLWFPDTRKSSSTGWQVPQAGKGKASLAKWKRRELEPPLRRLRSLPFPSSGCFLICIMGAAHSLQWHPSWLNQMASSEGRIEGVIMPS